MGVRYDKSKDRIKLREVEYLSAQLRYKIFNSTNLYDDDAVGYEYSGFMGKRSIEPKPIFNKAECEKIVADGQNNAQIVIGRDRPAQIGSGYQGIGATHSAAIDLVAGRTGRESRNVDTGDMTLVADNDFKSDSARIYITERTDIDVNFGIVPGRLGNATGRSGIGIKADNVRIVAREGIKLVTRTDDTNSKGGKTDIILGVDIIAGNDDSDLQPMVKGDNLVQLLKYMVDDSRRLAQMIHSLSLSQASLEAMLTAHTHVTGGAAGPGVAIPSIELGVFCGTSQIKRLISDIPSQVMQTFNNIAEEIEFLEVYGPKYINSRSNHVN